MERRRTFLKQGMMGIIALMSALVIIPSSVLGNQAPSKRITVGMVGTGRQGIGVRLKKGSLKLKNCRGVVVCDVDSWRMETASDVINKVYKIKNAVKSFSDYHELIADRSVDAIVCPAPDHWHVPVGITAALAKKPISMEKALTIGYNNSKTLVKAAQATGVANRLDSEFRSCPEIWKTVQGVRNGGAGELKHVAIGIPAEFGSAIGPQKTMPVPKELNYDMWLGPAFEAPYTTCRVHPQKKVNSRPGWIRIADYCNGVITNWGAHLWNTAMWGMDREHEMPLSVEGSGTFGKGLGKTIETFNLGYTYKDGFKVSYIMDTPNVRFEGDKGWIKLFYRHNPVAGDPSIIQALNKPGEFDFSKTLTDKADFLHSIEIGKPALEPLSIGYTVYGISYMGLCCATLGRKLTWDSAADCFVDDNAANAMFNRPFREKWLNKDVAAWLYKYQHVAL